MSAEDTTQLSNQSALPCANTKLVNTYNLIKGSNGKNLTCEQLLTEILADHLWHETTKRYMSAPPWPFY